MILLVAAAKTGQIELGEPIDTCMFVQYKVLDGMNQWVPTYAGVRTEEGGLLSDLVMWVLAAARRGLCEGKSRGRTASSIGRMTAFLFHVFALVVKTMQAKIRFASAIGNRA